MIKMQDITKQFNNALKAILDKGIISSYSNKHTVTDKFSTTSNILARYSLIGLTIYLLNENKSIFIPTQSLGVVSSMMKNYESLDIALKTLRQEGNTISQALQSVVNQLVRLYNLVNKVFNFNEYNSQIAESVTELENVGTKELRNWATSELNLYLGHIEVIDLLTLNMTRL